MALDSATMTALAQRLEQAQFAARPVAQLTLEYPALTIDDAYYIQEAIQEIKEQRGDRTVGYKAGLTSRAKMIQMGVSTPSYGFLSSSFVVADGDGIETGELIHPRVEPEIAFMLKRSLRGPGCHVGQVIAATEFIVPALEVIDSRYQNFKFDLASVVADNSSSARFVIGAQTARPGDLDLRTLGIVLEKNGVPIAFGAGAAVLGHPASSVAMLANMLGKRGRELPAGTLVLTGGVTEAVAAAAGDVLTMHGQSLGQVSVRFV
jgi:2-oxo-3-hexenedioate decarboxylase